MYLNTLRNTPKINYLLYLSFDKCYRYEQSKKLFYYIFNTNYLIISFLELYILLERYYASVIEYVKYIHIINNFIIAFYFITLEYELSFRKIDSIDL